MKLLLFALPVIFLACECKTESFNFASQSEPQFPYLVDSIPPVARIYNVEQMNLALGTITYIGTYADTIHLNSEFPDWSPYYIDYASEEAASSKFEGLKLLVSSSQVLSEDLKQYTLPPFESMMSFEDDSEEELKQKEATVKAWRVRPRDYIETIPVMIYNPTKESLHLELKDLQLMLTQEAKDENGTWKPVEYWIPSSCGNSYDQLKIDPQVLLIVEVFKYQGDFQTEMRIKLFNGGQIIYSNTFPGSINKRQFILSPEIENVLY